MNPLTLIPWPYRLLAVLAACLAAFGAGYIKGAAHEQTKLIVGERNAAVRVVKIERKQAAISNEVATSHEAARSRDRIIYQTIEKEVDRYVANPNRLVAGLDRSWVCQHDAAALSVVPDTACILDARTSGLTTDDALRTTTGNYEACKDNERQLRDLQDWIRRQHDATEISAKKIN